MKRHGPKRNGRGYGDVWLASFDRALFEHLYDINWKALHEELLSDPDVQEALENLARVTAKKAARSISGRGDSH